MAKTDDHVCSVCDETFESEEELEEHADQEHEDIDPGREEGAESDAALNRKS